MPQELQYVFRENLSGARHRRPQVSVLGRSRKGQSTHQCRWPNCCYVALLEPNNIPLGCYLDKPIQPGLCFLSWFGMNFELCF